MVHKLNGVKIWVLTLWAVTIRKKNDVFKQNGRQPKSKWQNLT